MTEQALATAGQQQNPLFTLLADPGKLKDVPIDTVERLLALQREMVDAQARREFNEAFTAAQHEMTPVRRMARNTQTGSLYARAEHVERMLDPISIGTGSRGRCPQPTARWLTTCGSLCASGTSVVIMRTTRSMRR